VENLDIILFAIAGISTLVGAVYLMASAGMSKEVQDYNWHPMKDGGPESPEFKKYMRKVTKRVHPEMVDVEPGEELMGVTFEKPDSCSLEEYKDLQARIEILRAELEGDEEDDDDDGDVIISRV
jgi:hypothetical protein